MLWTARQALFDMNILGISPVNVDQKLLAEVNGPVLLHGLQDMHGTALTVRDQRRTGLPRIGSN